MSLLSPQLEAFFAVANRGTVQAASKELGLTQTGVTQRLRSLEGNIKATLFTRSRRGMRLTPEGNELYRYCEDAIELEGRLQAKIHGQGGTHEATISISGPSSVMRCRVIPACAALRERFPRLFFSFDLDDGDNVFLKLKEGTSDLVIVPPHQVGLEVDSKVLRNERYILVGSSAWKGRKLKEIVRDECIIDFDSHDKMTLSYLSKAHLAKTASHTRCHANNTDALTSLIEQKVGYSVLTQEFAAPFLKKGTLIELNPDHHYDFPLALAWFPRGEMPAFLKAVIASIR